MHVFVTGATGYIGSAVVDELLRHGHQVLGLARSDAGAQRLVAAGAKVRRGDLADPAGLAAAAAGADAVVHLAFDHSNMADLPAAAAADRSVVAALGAALVGTGKPLITTYGVTGLLPGTAVTEQFRPDPARARALVEADTLALAEQEVRAVSVRPATSVHGELNAGFVAYLVAVARRHQVSAFPGDGTQRWPAVHRRDAAALYRLAVEQAPAGGVLHAVHEEGVTQRAIAEAIGAGLGLPVESVPTEQAPQWWGWMGNLLTLDTPASSAATRSLLDWTPSGPTLVEDIAAGTFFTG